MSHKAATGRRGQTRSCQKRNCPPTAGGRDPAVQARQGCRLGKAGLAPISGVQSRNPYTWAHLNCYSLMDLGAEKRTDSVCRELIFSSTIYVDFFFFFFFFGRSPLFWWNIYRNLHRVAEVIHSLHFEHWVWLQIRYDLSCYWTQRFCVGQT